MIDFKTTQDPKELAIFKNAIDNAYKNPDDIRAIQLSKMIMSGDYDNTLQQIGTSRQQMIQEAKQRKLNNPNTNIQQENTQENQGLIPNIKEDISKRIEDFKQAPTDTNPIIATGENILRVGGQIAGGVTDVLGDVVGVVTPEAIKEPVKHILGKSMESLGITDAMSKYEEWSKQHPEAAANLNAIANIGSLYPIGKTGKVGIEATKDVAESSIKSLPSKVLETIKTRLNKKPIKDTLEETLDIIRPKMSSKILEEASASGRGFKEGILKTQKYKPSQEELSIAKSVKKFVSKNKTIDENILSVRNTLKKKANYLRKNLKKIKSTWDSKNLINIVDNTEIPISIKSEASLLKASKLLKNSLLQIAEKTPKTAEGLLDLRQEFDKLVRKEYPNMFEGGIEKPINKYVKNLRKEINNFTEKSLPEGKLPNGIKYTDALKEQSNMFSAVENISTKAEKVGSNVITRATDIIKQNPLISAVAGVGLITEASTIASIITNPIALTTLAGYGAYKVGGKLITAGKVRKFLLNTIEKTEDLAQKEALQTILQQIPTKRIIVKETITN